MKIYQAEKLAGLEQEISVASATWNCHTYGSKKIAIAAASEQDWDEKLLYRFDSVLASTGWNGNDDVFLPKYVWAARHSPVDKMVNMHHDHSQIIGHMTSTFAQTFDGELISDDIALDELPKEFDIIVSSVIYKKMRTDAQNEAMATLISEIENGEWSVSMEARFDDFHYMAINSSGEWGIIQRNETTAFLTKHLRAFGGTGQFQGFQIGRILADFSFSGKGLVKQPANKRSIILNSSNHTDASNLEQQITQAKLETDMENKDHEVALAKIKELEHEIFSLKTQLNEVVAENQQLAADVKASKEELVKRDETIAQRDKTIEAVNAEKSELSERVSVAGVELNAMKEEKKQTERKSKLVSAGVNEDDAKNIVDKWVSVSDEQFDEVVALHKKAPATPAPETHPEAKDEAEASETDVDNVSTASQETPAPPASAEDSNDFSIARQWVQTIIKTNKKEDK